MTWTVYASLPLRLCLRWWEVQRFAAVRFSVGTPAVVLKHPIFGQEISSGLRRKFDAEDESFDFIFRLVMDCLCPL